MNQGAFAAHLGTSPATINSIYTGRTRPTLAIVESIKQRMPNINLEWLMFGTGSMYASDSDDQCMTSNGSQTSTMGNSSADGSTHQGSPNVQQRGESFLDFSDDVSSTPTFQSAPKRQQEVVKTELKYIDKPQRKIKEIRIFFDDGTYESFESKK